MRPQTARELWDVLTGIFPGFAANCTKEEIQPNTTLHFVMRDFTPYLSGNRETFSELQIKALARFIASSMMRS